MGVPIFILGRGRCGSTRLRRLLNAHPRIALTDEAQVLDFLHFAATLAGVPSGQSRRFSYRRAFHTFGLVGRDYTRRFQKVFTDSIPGLLERFYRREFPGKHFTHWGDKLPDPAAAAAIQHLIPETRFILMVRDPRAQIASWRRYATRRRELGDDLGDRDWDVKTMATVWNNTALSCHKHLSPLHTLRYEDFMSDERGHVQEVLEYLDLDMAPAIETELLDHSGIVHHGTSQSTESSIDDWTDDLDAREIRTIETVTTEARRLLGYG